jgi:hypothetical protein
MRKILSGVAATCLLISQAAGAQTCAKPAEMSAFDVAKLKSQLMVTALACDVRDRYNDFVHRFQAELMAKERALLGYFSRAFGHRGQQEHDVYITNLANAQSEAGVQKGTLFCQQSVSLFDAVLSLPTASDLAGFAASRDLPQPITLISCAAVPPPKATRQAQRGLNR